MVLFLLIYKHIYVQCLSYLAFSFYRFCLYVCNMIDPFTTSSSSSGYSRNKYVDGVLCWRQWLYDSWHLWAAGARRSDCHSRRVRYRLPETVRSIRVARWSGASRCQAPSRSTRRRFPLKPFTVRRRRCSSSVWTRHKSPGSFLPP